MSLQMGSTVTQTNPPQGTAFDVRAFVALTLGLSGLGLPATGVANHVYGFSPMSVARHAWMAAHNVLALVFTVFAIWHVVLNGRALSRYLRCAFRCVPGVSRESVAAIAVVASTLLPFVWHAVR